MTCFSFSLHSERFRLQRWCRLGAVLLMLALVLTGTVWGDVYKWRDAQGKLHFSDTAPTTEYTQTPEIRSVPAEAPPPASTAVPGTVPSQTLETFTGTMLWQVAGGRGQVNYILGTIHSEDPRVMQLPKKVQDALDGSRRFIMEVILDATAMIQLSTAMMFEDGRDLKRLIGETLFSQAAQAMAEVGVPEMALLRMKPWAVATLLSAPRPQTGQFLDMALYNRALGQGKEVGGLETAREQIAVFDTMSVDDQVELLEQALAERSKLPQIFEQLIVSYVAGDLQGIEALARANMMGVNRGLGARMMNRLNDQRNEKMVQRLVSKLEAGGTFAAVGALHLPGKAGILHLLQKRGYTISPVH